jgi:XTP/dITP diphosphohydrolase
MKKILIATKNPGKLLEYYELMKEFPFEIVSLKDLRIIDEPEEDQLTFEGNAAKKANFYSDFIDFPVLAEDSGLEIDYLNGEPGVLSRRWPGYKATDKELIEMVLEKLKGVPINKRGAQFRVAMALKFPHDEKIFFGEGIMRGFLTEKPIKKIIPGYPFRSLFYNPDIGKIIGEMTMEEEAKIGHRKQAILKLLPHLLKYAEQNKHSNILENVRML